ncbi:acyl carrier protein [Clostridium felsineum]|nr:acyl carrier protein [Clostridium felsineum]
MQEKAKTRIELCEKIKQVIVDQLALDIEPTVITDDQPLFGRGLELDSVDALELVVGIDAEFDVSISDDNIGVFSSVNKIADYIEEKQEED